MSLQIWMPFNGSTANQGLLGEATIGTTCTFTTGKIGQALSTGSMTLTAEQTATVLNNKAISICFWIKVTGDDRKMIFGNDSMVANNNRKFSVFQYPSINDLHISWMNDAASTTFIAAVLYGVFPTNTWVHCAITYNNPTCKVYINGELKATYSGVSNSTSFAYATQLIYNSSGRLLNDFRIYNNCLSAKEVKEIAKGLCLHYMLNNRFNTSLTNKYEGSYAAGYMAGSYTRTQLISERGYNYTYNYTGTGSNSWPNMCCSNFSFTSGKKYYYSCEVRVHSANFSIYLRASRSNNDWVTNMTRVVSSSQADNEWHRYVVYQTINDTYDRSGSTITCNPVLEFYSESLAESGKVYTCDFDVRNIMVVEATEDIQYIDNALKSSVVSDTSGFGNSGNVSGSLVWNSSTARYNGSYNFSNGTDYIKSNFSLSMPQVSCSFWVCPSSTNGSYSILASNYSYPANGFWIATNCEGAGMWFYNGSYAKSGSITSLTANTWYHGCFVFDTGIAKWYVNGALVSTTDISSRSTSLTISNLTVGNSYTGSSWPTARYGNISDFRLYATALSADDVSSLYKVSASIDDLQNLHCYELIEDAKNKISKTGIVNYPSNILYNYYSGKQANCSSGTLTYNYATDIFKDYGFSTCTKWTADTSKSGTQFMAYSYFISTNAMGFSTNSDYTFSLYAYVSEDCNTNFRIHLEHSNTWTSNYLGTTSNIIDSTKGKVIWVWGKCKASASDGLVYIMFYPNPNQTGLFTSGYILFTGLTIYPGTDLVRPQAFTGSGYYGFSESNKCGINKNYLTVSELMED